MRKRFLLSFPQILLIVVFSVLVTAVGVLAASGTTDSPAAPGSTSSYTLEDLYQRLVNGTTGTQSTFTEPSVAPGTGTMHDINALMAAAPEEDPNGATTDDVLPGKTFWGLTNGEWGLQTGVGDSDLVPENIKYGVTIFGVTGTYIRRFQENGDGTVTDTYTDLIWTKDANAGESTWNDAFNYCDTLAFAGASDWRLPKYTELEELITLPDGICSTSPQMFYQLQPAYYWSNTFSHKSGGNSYYIMFHMEMGSPAVDDAADDRYFWCVRNE